MIKKTYYITGMHCPGCETLIERSVGKIKGVTAVKVSLARGKIEIQARSPQAMPTAKQLNQRFKQDGYAFSEHRQKTDLQPGKFAAVIGAFLLIVLLFFLLERSTLLNFLYVDSNSNFVAYFLFGLAAGFSSCAALVGSLLLSVQESWVNQASGRNKNGFSPFILFNGARLVSFAALGGLLGLLGGVFQFSLEASAVLTILISVLIFIIGMQMLGVPLFQRIPLNLSGRWIGRVTNQPGLQNKIMPILVGMVTFFVPCGFTLIAQAGALRTGTFLEGMTILLAFALGTLPMLLMISFSSVKLRQNPKFSNAFRLLSGLLIVFFSAYTLITQISLLRPSTQALDNPANASTSTAALQEEGEYQLMQMEARGFEYFPEVITIKAHLPTRFEIFSNDSLGCANAVYARGLYPDVIILNPGINVVEFTAPGPGTYQISCSMWMVKPITVVVE